MKSAKFKHFILIIVVLQFGFMLSAQTTYVPDDNFEQELINLGYDDVLDDYVLTTNINTVTALVLYDKGIFDLTGIEDFTSMEFLNVKKNELSSLNINQNINLRLLDCNKNQLTELDISQNVNLTYLTCTDNLLTSLDVSNHLLLQHLFCGNNFISELDLKNNTNLQSFTYNSYSPYSYQLAIESIDLRNGNNAAISHLTIYNNRNLKCVFVDDANAQHSNWDINYGTFINNEVECDALSIKDNNLKSEITLYPNPVKDILHIDNTFSLNIEKINLYDVQGKQIISLSNDFDQIDFKNIVSGLYFINIQTENGTVTKKIIKN